MAESNLKNKPPETPKVADIATEHELESWTGTDDFILDYARYEPSAEELESLQSNQKWLTLYGKEYPNFAIVDSKIPVKKERKRKRANVEPMEDTTMQQASANTHSRSMPFSRNILEASDLTALLYSALKDETNTLVVIASYVFSSNHKDFFSILDEQKNSQVVPKKKIVILFDQGGFSYVRNRYDVDVHKDFRQQILNRSNEEWRTQYNIHFIILAGGYYPVTLNYFKTCCIYPENFAYIREEEPRLSPFKCNSRFNRLAHDKMLYVSGRNGEFALGGSHNFLTTITDNKDVVYICSPDIDNDFFVFSKAYALSMVEEASKEANLLQAVLHRLGQYYAVTVPLSASMSSSAASSSIRPAFEQIPVRVPRRSTMSSQGYPEYDNQTLEVQFPRPWQRRQLFGIQTPSDASLVDLPLIARFFISCVETNIKCDMLSVRITSGKKTLFIYRYSSEPYFLGTGGSLGDGNEVDVYYKLQLPPGAISPQFLDDEIRKFMDSIKWGLILIA